MPFFCIHISQGSVATCLKRGGIFKHEFVANFLPSPLVKKNFENRVIVGEVMAKSLVSWFLTHDVCAYLFTYLKCFYVLLFMCGRWQRLILVNLTDVRTCVSLL